MKRLIIILILTGVVLAKYNLVITIETETIKEAGKIESIVLKRLKEYDPDISIETKPEQLYYNGLILDTLEFESVMIDSVIPFGKMKTDTIYRNNKLK